MSKEELDYMEFGKQFSVEHLATLIDRRVSSESDQRKKFHERKDRKTAEWVVQV